VLLERQRIMREIHDGVGSQLVGLLNVVTQPAPDRGVVEEHVKLALDEMRMAVDSLQPTHDDLPTVLATLRYRLQPRLDAAGIELVWDVAVMPAARSVCRAGRAAAATHIARSFHQCAEARPRHAHRDAGRLARRQASPPLVRIVLTDNGQAAFPRPPTDGRPAWAMASANMRARAQSIGARLHIENGATTSGGGTRVRLDWPCALP
jgi:signal transduction histidine kinase